MNVVIQPATLEFVESFRAALDVVARERRYLLFTEAPSLEETIRFVADMLESGSSAFHAIHSGRVIGWCDVVRRKRPGLNHCGSLAIGVLPDYRGQGIGRRLISATIEDSFARGMTRIELEVFASNERSIQLYRKCGFVEEGRKRKARFIDGAYDDFIVMALLRESDENGNSGSGGSRCD